MDYTTDFEIAQRRLRERQSKQSALRFWIIIFALLIAFNVAFGGVVAGTLIPFEVGSLILIFVTGIQLYYASHPVSQALIEQEMVWLFGEDWQDFTSAEEYTFAQDRIRKRRLGRWLFFFHIPIFLFVNWLLIGIPQMVNQYGSGSTDERAVNIAFYFIVGLWTLFLMNHARQAFPTAAMLGKREHKAAEALKFELQNMRHEKRKRDRDITRHPLYDYGNDEARDVEKPKHNGEDDDLP